MTAREPRSGWDVATTKQHPPVPLGHFAVRVELGDAITEEELRHDLDADPFHWLHELAPRLGEAASGRVTVDLTVPGPDVWTATLTTMAVLSRSGYGMHALHVVAQEARDQQSAA